MKVFVVLSLLVLAGQAAADRFLREAEPPKKGRDLQTSFDVLIVGGGAAGLLAAYDIHHAGSYSYRVLEANSAIGGRMSRDTSDFADFPVDIGGEWIHNDPSILLTLANQDTAFVTDNIGTRFYDKYLAQLKWNAATQEYEFQGDYWDWFKSTPDHKYTGTKWCWADFYSDVIANVTKDNGRVQTSCQVTAIDYSSSPAKVTSSCGEWTANKVIVTVSMGILKAGVITFTPALPQAKQDAISFYNFMPGMKVFLKFSDSSFYTGTTFGEPFAFEDHYPLGQSAGDSDRYYFDATFGRDSATTNILGMLAVGTQADPLKDMSDSDIIANSTYWLKEYYSEADVNGKFVEGKVVNWYQNQHVRGAYCQSPSDEGTTSYTNRIAEMQTGVNDILFFAGECVPPDGDIGFGYAHGAGLSGRKAAETVLQQLGSTPSPTPAPTPAPAGGGCGFLGWVSQAYQRFTGTKNSGTRRGLRA